MIEDNRRGTGPGPSSQGWLLFQNKYNSTPTTLQAAAGLHCYCTPTVPKGRQSPLAFLFTGYYSIPLGFLVITPARSAIAQRHSLKGATFRLTERQTEISWPASSWIGADMWSKMHVIPYLPHILFRTDAFSVINLLVAQGSYPGLYHLRAIKAHCVVSRALLLWSRVPLMKFYDQRTSATQHPAAPTLPHIWSSLPDHQSFSGSFHIVCTAPLGT